MPLETTQKPLLRYDNCVSSKPQKTFCGKRPYKHVFFAVDMNAKNFQCRFKILSVQTISNQKQKVQTNKDSSLLHSIFLMQDEQASNANERSAGLDSRKKEGKGGGRLKITLTCGNNSYILKLNLQQQCGNLSIPQEKSNTEILSLFRHLSFAFPLTTLCAIAVYFFWLRHRLITMPCRLYLF